MDPEFIIVGVVSTSFILIYIFTKTRNLYLSKDKIEDSIIKYYDKNGFIVNNVADLNITERLKYGVPIISIFRLYSYFFGFFSGKIDYVRKVEIVDGKNIKRTKYIELTVHGKDTISFKEFAS